MLLILQQLMEDSNSCISNSADTGSGSSSHGVGVEVGEAAAAYK